MATRNHCPLTNLQLREIAARHCDGLDPASAAHDLARLLDEVDVLRAELHWVDNADDGPEEEDADRVWLDGPPPPGYITADTVYSLEEYPGGRGQRGALTTPEAALAALRHA